MEEILKSIDKKMNAIISLLLDKDKSNQEDKSEREIIKRLADLKLDYESIGLILNKTAKQISDQVYLANKKKAKVKNAKSK